MFNSSVSFFFFFLFSFFFSCEEDFVLCKNEAIVLNVPKVSMGHKHVIINSYVHALKQKVIFKNKREKTCFVLFCFLAHVQRQTALDDL